MRNVCKSAATKFSWLLAPSGLIPSAISFDRCAGGADLLRNYQPFLRILMGRRCLIGALKPSRPIADADLPDADVVISTWWETAEWAASLSPEKGAKAFFIQHYEAFEGLPKERVDAVWRLPFHKITISKWLVELAADRFGDRDVSLVLNSVDPNQFHSVPRRRQRVPTIGFLHHNLRWKGIGVSLDAIRHTLKTIPKLRLLTFGTAPFDEPLPDSVEHVHWQQPAQDFIRKIYGACDVWLCGSTTEGFHLPPLEAMACRCPVVSTAVGGPMDIVTPRGQRISSSRK